MGQPSSVYIVRARSLTRLKNAEFRDDASYCLKVKTTAPSTSLRAGSVSQKRETRTGHPRGHSVCSQLHLDHLVLMGEVQAEVGFVTVPEAQKFPVAVLVTSLFGAQNLHAATLF